MIIRCTQCDHARTVHDSKVPANAEYATCPRCKHRFRFRTLEPIRDARPLFAAQNSQPKSPPVAPSSNRARPAHLDIWEAMESLNDQLSKQLDKQVVQPHNAPLPTAHEAPQSASNPAEPHTNKPLPVAPSQTITHANNKKKAAAPKSTVVASLFKKLASRFTAKQDAPLTREEPLEDDTLRKKNLELSTLADEEPLHEQPHYTTAHDEPLPHEDIEEELAPYADEHESVQTDTVVKPTSAAIPSFVEHPTTHSDLANQTHNTQDQNSRQEDTAVPPTTGNYKNPWVQETPLHNSSSAPLQQNQASPALSIEAPLHSQLTAPEADVPTTPPATQEFLAPDQHSLFEAITLPTQQPVAHGTAQTVPTQNVSSSECLPPCDANNAPAEQTDTETEVESSPPHTLQHDTPYPVTTTEQPVTAQSTNEVVTNSNVAKQQEAETPPVNVATSALLHAPHTAPAVTAAPPKKDSTLDTVLARHSEAFRYSFEDTTKTAEEKTAENLRLLQAGTNRPVKDLGRIDEFLEEDQLDAGLKAGASPIPWENIRQHGWFLGFIRTIHGVMFNTPLFFTYISDKGSLTPSYLFSLVQTYLAILCFAAWRSAFTSLMSSTSAPVPEAQQFLPALLLLAPVALGLLLVFLTGCTRLIVRVFTTQPLSFHTLFKVLCYSTAPLILSLIPFVGPAVGSCWFFFALITGCQITLRLKLSQAIVAIIPTVVCVTGMTMLLLFN